MEKAVAEVHKLSKPDQDALAIWILEELASERRWRKAFARSPDVLASLAEEAIKEYREGRTRELDTNKL